MRGLVDEIEEIPKRALECLKKNKHVKLPSHVPYIGMGASYCASLTLFYCGKDIQPRIASEYYYYLSPEVRPLGVLISQSGESSETLWCLEKLDNVTVITNNPSSTMATSPKTREIIELHAGDERYFSSTKTFINTLVTLYLGLGIDPQPVVAALDASFSDLMKNTEAHADAIAHYVQSRAVTGLYIIGSGPNSATAAQGALIMAETTKLSWIGMPLAQYDHGPKETADNSVVIILNSSGRDRKRIGSLTQTLRQHSNALVIELLETRLDETLTPITLATSIMLLMNHLADRLKIKDTFVIGDKITRVPNAIK